MNKASSGDTIYILNANGAPYEECPKYENRSAIQLNKSLSFICPNGMAEIQCRYSENRVIFEIPENSHGKQTMTFVSIKFTTPSNRALVNSHNDTRIIINSCLFQKNNIAIYMKNMRKCDLLVDNSTFIDNCDSGIFARYCVDMVVRISNSTFQCSPVKLSDAEKLNLWNFFQVYITNSSFLGNSLAKHHNEVQGFLFQVNCHNASVFNISVVFSTFGNFIGTTKYYKRISGPIYINDLRRQPDVRTTIYFNQVIVKNIVTAQRSTVLLFLSATMRLGSTVEILNCSFYNNTRALKISGRRTNMINTDRNSRVKIRIENTIFSRNYNPGNGHGAAATLLAANFHIDGCRFVNNYSQNRYLTGVVVLDANAWVTFEWCLFQNTYVHHPNERALQILSPGNTNVIFKAQNVFNLRKLRRNQPIIIHTSPYSHSPSVNLGMVFLHGKLELKCPVGYRFVSYTDKPMNKTKDFQHLEFNCFQCSYKTYSLERDGIHNNIFGGIDCHDCPRAGVCRNGRLKSRPNFWGYKTTNSKVFFLNCPPGYCCQSNDECKTYNSCHGNRDGTLCGRCKQGTSELLFGTECQSNKDCESRYFWIAISVIVPLYCLFFLYYNAIMKFLATAFFAPSKTGSQNSSDSLTQSNSTETHPDCMFGGYLTIIFYYYQIIHIFNSSVPDRGKAFKFIDHLLTPIFNFLVSENVFHIKCPFKDLQPIHKVAILNSLGFLLLIFIGLLFIAWKVITAFKRSRLDSKPLYIDAVVQNDQNDGTSVDFKDENHETGQSFKCRIASAFTQISLLMYSSSAQLCLTLLHCVPIKDQKVLFIDGTLKCYQIFQYFAFIYVTINIIPFCLVPILGSYLLAFDSICLTEFFLGCLFPLPFCVKWALLLFKMWRRRFSEGYVAVSSLKVASTPKSAILQVLLGPFRSHSPFLGFPESPIPWEGFLIFRRLVIILLFTFVYDINLRMGLVLAACVIILILHLAVKPFKRPCDNILETLSLGILITLCGLTHVKLIYSDDVEATLDLHPDLLSWISIIECVLIVTPLLLSLLVIFGAVVYLFLVWFLKLMLHFRQ